MIRPCGRTERLKDLNFGWVIPRRLGGAAFPGLGRDLEDLWAEGARALVSATLTPAPLDLAPGLSFRFHHIPMADGRTPDDESLRSYLDFVDQSLVAGLPVVVHCAMGQGRTGTLLAAYLMSQGLDAQEAIDRVRETRPHSIETRGQEEFLLGLRLGVR